ncbi:hypothetical protein HNR42_001962 [Deinobacterium chartae]|uniref:Roadblock/LAMTOR2 domain-containing protein n=1 Tax=Deinobacterium chartae TaxID=521158 RepID=A0A841I2F6_9DEIO|nr:hypothetical protein [Deinobacterium chartae]MBB6098528.1 hypothetical protein [Deinobacterium chartae]
MNISKLNKCMDDLRATLGTSVESTAIWGPDGLALVGYEVNPVAVALFHELTGQLSSALSQSNFPGLGRFFIAELEGNKLAVVLVMNDYRWGMTVDGAQGKLGLLFSVAIPQALNNFKEALYG